MKEGRYKFFICENYRGIVFNRLKQDLIEAHMADKETTITLGLVAGKVYQSRGGEILVYFVGSVGKLVPPTGFEPVTSKLL